MLPLSKNWQLILKNELQSEDFKKFEKWLKNEYKLKTIFPEYKNIFNALNLVDYSNIKVVIIGQDPYHEPNQAHGLAFSVLNSKIPPSLKNIYKEIENEYNVKLNKTGNLTNLAKQGVLLINSILTVEKGKANSHKGKGWEKIIEKLIEKLNERKKPIIFMSWGNQAHKIIKNINTKKHFIIKNSHPSPLSANKGGWFNCNQFKKVNEILKSLNEKEIDWTNL